MPDTYYIIEKLLETFDCKIMCYDCRVCSHVYICTFLDGVLHAIICKHIHLVYMETSDNVVCKDRASANTDYSYVIDALSSKSKKKTFIGRRRSTTT